MSIGLELPRSVLSAGDGSASPPNCNVAIGYNVGGVTPVFTGGILDTSWDTIEIFFYVDPGFFGPGSDARYMLRAEPASGTSIGIYVKENRRYPEAIVYGDGGARAFVSIPSMTIEPLFWHHLIIQHIASVNVMVMFCGKTGYYYNGDYFPSQDAGSVSSYASGNKNLGEDTKPLSDGGTTGAIHVGYSTKTGVTSVWWGGVSEIRVWTSAYISAFPTLAQLDMYRNAFIHTDDGVGEPFDNLAHCWRLNTTTPLASSYVDSGYMGKVATHYFSGGAHDSHPFAAGGSAEHTGSGTTRGEGRLKGSGYVIVEGAGTSRGEGRLTGEATVLIPGSGSIRGEGRLSGIGTVYVTGAGKSRGEGRLRGSITVGVKGSGTARGEGRLRGSGTVEVFGSGQTRGEGSLSGAGYSVAVGSGQCRGEGRLTGSGRVDIRSGGSIRGEGRLSGSGYIITSGKGQCRGEGRLTGSGNKDGGGSGVLRGEGRLTGSGHIVKGSSGQCRGEGRLSGLANVDMQGSASFRGEGRLAGAAYVKTHASGTTRGEGRLTGSGIVDHKGAGILRGEGRLRGLATMSLKGLGTARGEGRLSGSGIVSVVPSAGEIIRSGRVRTDRAEIPSMLTNAPDYKVLHDEYIFNGSESPDSIFQMCPIPAGYEVFNIRVTHSRLTVGAGTMSIGTEDDPDAWGSGYPVGQKGAAMPQTASESTLAQIESRYIHISFSGATAFRSDSVMKVQAIVIKPVTIVKGEIYGN